MNLKTLLFAILIVGFGSCTTAYRSAQTPDDVYYSPTPVYQEDEQSEVKEDQRTDRNTSYLESEEEREIRLRIRDRRYRYSTNHYSDYYTYNTPYYYGHNTYYNNPYYYGHNYNNYWYQPYYGFNTYYYPSYPTKGSSITYQPRKYNLNPRNTNTTNNVTPKGQGSNTPTRTFRNNSGLRNTINKALNLPRNSTPTRTTRSNDNNTANPVRTFDPPKSNTSSSNNNSSSSSSSSSGSSSSGSAPVRTFNR